MDWPGQDGEDSESSSSAEFPGNDIQRDTRVKGWPPKPKLQFTSSTGLSEAISASSQPQEKNEPLNADTSETQHLDELANGGGFGARMLAKMGWTGKGLGSQGKGITTPLGVDVSVRKRQLGVGLGQETVKGSDEKEAAEQEPAPKKADSGKRKPRKRRTYEEMLHGEEDQTSNEAGALASVVTDLSGNILPSVHHASEEKRDITRDPQLFKESLYNINLLVSHYEVLVSADVNEGRNLYGQQKSLQNQLQNLDSKAALQAHEMSRLEELVSFVSSDTVLWQNLKSSFNDLYGVLNLELVLVSALDKTLSKLWEGWDCLADPGMGLDLIRANLSLMDSERVQKSVMSPYETLMWTRWLPFVRASSWTIQDPERFITLLSLWEPYTPLFIRRNILEQLVWPRLERELDVWKPGHSSLSSIVFPWLEYVLHIDRESPGELRRLFEISMRPLTSWLKAVGYGPPPSEFALWQQVLPQEFWDKLVIRTSVPRLREFLVERVDTSQSPDSLRDPSWIYILKEWSRYLKPGVLGQLFDTAFIPRYLDNLHAMVTGENFDGKVVQNYRVNWHRMFHNELQAYGKSLDDFLIGDTLIRDAMLYESTGSVHQRQSLAKPRASKAGASTSRMARTRMESVVAIAQDITLRSLLEDFCHDHSLLVRSSGRVHEKFLLYEVFNGDTRASTLIYLDQDVLWNEAPSGQWVPVSFTDVAVNLW